MVSFLCFAFLKLIWNEPHFLLDSRDFDGFEFCEIDATQGCTIHCFYWLIYWNRYRWFKGGRCIVVACLFAELYLMVKPVMAVKWYLKSSFIPNHCHKTIVTSYNNRTAKYIFFLQFLKSICLYNWSVVHWTIDNWFRVESFQSSETAHYSAFDYHINCLISSVIITHPLWSHVP